jgi:hypothetical protein
MKDNDAATFLRAHHRASTRAFQKHAYHLFAFYQAVSEMRRQLGMAAFRQWMSIHCPTIPWSDVEATLQHVPKTPLNQESIRRIINS